MRKLVITLTMVLCFLAAGAGHSASPREGYITPFDPERPTACEDPAVKPLTGIGYSRHAAAGAAAPVAPSAAAVLSNSVFEKFERCPFGDPLNPTCSSIASWKDAGDHIGYYRDVIFSASTLITNARDGETWTASFVRPDNSQIGFGTVSYDADSNCFNFPARQVCGSSSIRIHWYFDSQCSQTGLWFFRAFNDGAKFADVQFQFVPRLGTDDELADKLIPFSQADPAWAAEPYANICHRPGINDKEIESCTLNLPGQVPWTIGQKGCGITALATILRYHGVDTNPKKLNDWLLENGYYRMNGEISEVEETAVLYAQKMGVNMRFIAVFTGNSRGASSEVCRYGPVDVRVRDNEHSVVGIGMDDASGTLLIHDVLDGGRRGLSEDYDGKLDYFTVYAGEELEFTDNFSRVSFKFFSPVQAFVVDPLGRRHGLDPRTGVSYNEIPGAFYGAVSSIGPGLPDNYEAPKLLDLPQPADGSYTLNVVGTGAGAYDADFTMYDAAHGRSQQQYVGIATAPGVVHTYQVEFSKAAGSVLVTGGGFDGGGQRPRDVNKFLSYAQPAASNTALPAGTTSYQLLVFYGRGVIPSTFRAQLNGADVTSLFSPSPGGSQAVRLPLQRGRNVLQLSIDGNLPSRVAADSDRLVFDVP
ncbi:MAG TPA: C39 family peptidase [Pyrinomonadaceae bacterium]|jgi:hypothetical protein|nr:C39 family peptidase [Pyrinomonadaceae bacterium]